MSPLVRSERADRPADDWTVDVLRHVLGYATGLLVRFPAISDHWPADRAMGHHDKLLGEAAMLLLAAGRLKRKELGRDVEALADALAGHVHSVRSKALLMRSRRNRHAVLLPHVVLRLLGREECELDDLLRKSADAAPGELVPFRMAEQAWVQSLDGGDVAPIDPFACDSIFTRQVSVHEMDRGDLYAVTHWVLYLTDLGSRPAANRLRSKVAALLHNVIAWQVFAEDLDLLGELLMVARMLHLPETPATRAGWAIFRAAWDRLGFVPSPTYMATDAQRLDGPAREAYEAAHSYHTMFVMGMACAAGMASKTEPLPEEASEPSPDALIRLLRTTVARAAPFVEAGHLAAATDAESGPAGIPPFWAGVLSSLPWARSFVLDVETIGAMRSYDLAALARTIDARLRSGLPPSSTFLEGVRYLAAQQVPAGAIGGHFLIEQNRANPTAKLVTTVLADLLLRSAAYAEGAGSAP